MTEVNSDADIAAIWAVMAVQQQANQLAEALNTHTPVDVQVMATLQLAARLIRSHHNCDAAAAARILQRTLAAIHEAETLAGPIDAKPINKKPNPPVSAEWTAQERLRVVAAILPGLQEDIYAGRYSEPGRPNITSLQHIIYDEPADLEAARAEIEECVAAHEERFEQSRGYVPD